MGKTANGHGNSFYGDENVLELNSGNAEYTKYTCECAGNR